jgi:hypothetical protein
MPNLQQQIATELCRRTELLPQEIQDWNVQSDTNKYGMGIHQSQVKTVTKLFNSMLEKQNVLKKDMDPAQATAMSQETFTSKRMELEQLLTGSHSIMATFRYIFSQRDATQPFGEILDAADLVAACSYLPCIKIFNRWTGLPDENYREPPLIYLNAKLSPAALTRRHRFSLIGLALEAEEQTMLPLSIISLSFHNTVGFWTLSSIYHEVGHVLTQDIALTDDLSAVMQDKFAASPNKDWWSKHWLSEMIADTFGVLLGGEGFVRCLVNMLFNTKREVVEESGTGKHPNSYVRVFLLGALLRRTGVDEFRALADSIETEWKSFYDIPLALNTFVQECDTVADVLLNAPLTVLGDQRSLLSFALDKTSGINSVPDLARDHRYTKAIARYLPAKKVNNAYSEARQTPADLIRLIPAAAQLAIQMVETDHLQQFENIHKNAMNLTLQLQLDAQMEFLADDPAHEAYLDSLINKLNFSSLKVEGA